MPRLRRVRPRRVVQDQDDRLSALPEELIRLILSRLDTRSALSTAVLARRWARLPRDLPAYNFRVSDILPPEYDRTVALRRRNLPRNTAQARVLDGLMASCEVSAIRAFEDGITGFLETDARRCVNTLRLEFFHTHDGGRIVDNLIADAVGAWGVQDLEVVVRPASQEQEPAYSFPHHRLKDVHRSRLHSLTIGNCTLPPRLHCYHALTNLVLRDMPASTPVGVYERVLSECNQLQVLHLTSCSCDEDRLVVCSAALRELVVEACSFMVIQLQDLPMLSHLACLTNTVELVVGSVPCLTHTNLTFFVEEDILVFPPLPHHHDQLNHFLGMSPTMANLVIRFTGPKMWIGPNKLHMPLLHLKRLLVADLPSNWDVSWTRTLLMAAPSLEVLHINVAHSELPETYGIIWSISSKKQCHHHMEELVMAGFTLTPLQMLFLKFVVTACTSLQRLVLLKDGHVRYNGLWDWDLVRGLQESHWRDHDKRLLGRLIKSGPSPLVELTLG